MAPPGGASSGNILGGGYEPEAEVKKTQKQSQPISNVFGGGDDDAQQQANKNKARAQESSQNRLFGGPDDESKSSGKAQDGEDGEQEKKEEKNGDAESGEKKDESETQATPSPSQKGRGQYHPGKNYKGEDWATYDHSDEEEDKEKEKEKAKANSADEQNKGSYNPITNEEYAGSPKAAEPTQKPRRQPPGGHSSGLW